MSRRSQKLSRRLHLAVDLALAAVILAFTTAIALRFDRVFVFRDRENPLSRRAVSYLSKIEGQFRCIAVVPHDNIFYSSVRKLLLDMKDAARGADFILEFPDPHMDVSRAAAVISRHKSDGWCIVFEKGDRSEVVPLDQLVERKRTDGDSIFGDTDAGLRFNGEQQCVTALARLSRPAEPVIYALSGHGERNFADYDQLSGYSDLAREIRREGYQIEELMLSGSAGVPQDCALLVVAGPMRPPLAGECEAIVSWLDQGGRILFLIDRSDRVPNGWEPVASRLGISFPNLTAISEGTMGGYNVSVDTFSSHPVGRDLEKSAVVFSSPQVLDIDQEALVSNRLKADVVVAAPRRAWGERSPEVIPRIYDPDIDRKGDLPLAVAIGIDAAEDLGIPLMKAFVVGDSNIGSNAYMGGGTAGNRDILLNAIDWLTDSGLPLAPSKPSDGAALQLNISRKRQIRFWLISCLLWPLAIFLIGSVASSLRRMFS